MNPTMNPTMAACLPQSLNPLPILFENWGSKVGATIRFRDQYLTLQLLCRSSPSQFSGTTGQQRQGRIDSDVRG